MPRIRPRIRNATALGTHRASRLGALLLCALVVATTAGCGGGGKKKKDRSVAAETWTVMVYMAGDNDLEGAAIADLEEMEQVGSTDTFHLLVQLDTQTRNVHGSTSAKRMRVLPAPQAGIDSPVLDDLGEIAMSDEMEIVAFVEWSVANFPAQDYALVLWDHGGGWPGALVDESAQNPDDLVDLDELELALRPLQARTGLP